MVNVIYLSLNKKTNCLETIFFILLFFGISILFIYKIYTDNIYNGISFGLNHECSCFKNDIVIINKISDLLYIIKFKNKNYQIELKNDNSLTFTCNLYNTLKRGPNQKVIAYSLYGRNQKYYNYISNLTSIINHSYPGHIMRIYHDDSIDKNIICSLECSNSHVEFCDIHKVPISLTNITKYLDLKYMHSMMWRFLPIGDTFVDFFMSRDTDSFIVQRELDSVDVWIKSKNIGHIMRDHPWHGTSILGGMWGFKNYMDRKLANHIFKLVIDENIAQEYNPNGKSNKGYDQYFLTNKVYNLINLNSTTHDSYKCKDYVNSKPFPNKRVGNCFVAVQYNCSANSSFYPCPKKCRPSEHIDWEYC